MRLSSKQTEMTKTEPEQVRSRQWLVLFGMVTVCLGVGAIGGVITNSAVQTWYPHLLKPGWTPPNWVFGPVWTVLYILMAVAAWLVWLRGPTTGVTRGLAVFVVQLGSNLLWSILFFGLRSPGAAFVDVLVLCCAVWLTLLLFWQVRQIAGVLLVPYALWVSYASVLNGAIWWLNR